MTDACPTCGARHGGRRVLPAALLASLLSAVLVLGGVYLMLQSFGDALDSELDDQVTRVERNLDRDFARLQRQFRRELDARFP